MWVNKKCDILALLDIHRPSPQKYKNNIILSQNMYLSLPVQINITVLQFKKSQILFPYKHVSICNE